MNLVTRKFFLFLNLLLIAVFAWRLFALWGEIRYKDIDERNSVNYSLVDIKRPPLKIDEEYRNIFGVEALKATEPAKESGALNELVAGDEVIRVQGIFISEEIKCAVISIVDNKRKKHKTDGTEVKKYVIGDKIKDFSIVSILPESVSLADSVSNKIDLRIFKQF